MHCAELSTISLNGLNYYTFLRQEKFDHDSRIKFTSKNYV